MKVAWFFVSWLMSIHISFVFGGILLKHLTEQRPPGGFLEILKKPKMPGINIQLPSGGGGGFSLGASLGSFGFGFGFGGQYVPPGTGVNVPANRPHYPHVPQPKPHVPEVPPHEPHYPHVPQPKPHVPEVPPHEPHYHHVPQPKPHVPEVPPHVPEVPPHVPDPKPHLPGGTWEEDRGRPRPNWEEEYEEENPKRGSYEKDNTPNHKEDDRYDWDDIGEKNQEDSDSKSENFMNGELVEEGLIQPRLKKRRNKRFVESHVYHVPLLFRSNAKPFQVQIRSHLNSLVRAEK